MNVHITFKCAQGATAELDDQLAPWLPPHEKSASLCFSENPPMGIFLIADSLKWLAWSGTLFAAWKALGAGKFGEKLSEELGKKTAEILSDIAWDSESKTFKGLFKRLKHAFQGSDEEEATNAEKILELSSASGKASDQQVYMYVGLPAKIQDYGVIFRIGDLEDNFEQNLDLIAWFTLFEEPIRSASETLIEQIQEPIYSIQVMQNQSGFALYWLTVGGRKTMAQDFDVEGLPIGESRQAYQNG
jgi:hypothetical protein